MKNKFVSVAAIGGFVIMLSVSAAAGSETYHTHEKERIESVVTAKLPIAGPVHILTGLTTTEQPAYFDKVGTRYSYVAGRGFVDLDKERVIRTEVEYTENDVLDVPETIETITEEATIVGTDQQVPNDTVGVDIGSTTEDPYVEEPKSIEDTSVEEPPAIDDASVGESLPVGDDYSWVTPEIEYFAKCVMAEEGNQPWEGLVAVIDSILNMRDDPDYPDTIRGVINNPGVFTVVSNGMIYSANPTPRVYDAIKSQMEEFGGSRDNYDVMYFRTGHYHSFGTPLFRVNNVYFSGR